MRLLLALALSTGLAVLLSQFSGAGTADSAAKKAKKVANFTLKDSSGRAWSLQDCKGDKAVVVVFTGTECPINNAYMPRLLELHKEYGEKGVRFVAINSNRQDTVQRIADHAERHHLPFPVLKDENNLVADQFDAQRTPEVFILDGEGRIRYRGRIDDQFGIGYKRAQPTRRDLAEALDELLAGKEISTSQTRVAGCLIARASKPKTEGAITYSKQVSRILQKRCQECHRPGQIGPMPLLTYDDANDWSATIREVLEDGRMPPWHADPHYGKFENDRRLSKEERETLLTWIDQGCPKGSDKDLPAPRQFAEGWIIGKPDLVLTMKQTYTVPASTKRGIPYRPGTVATEFKEDTWVQAAEAKPGNRAVVHHIIVYIRPPGPIRLRNIGDGFLVGFAPGDMPAIFPPGQAKKIPKGSWLIFQMHYTPNGVEQTDQSSVGLIFAKEPPKTEVFTRAIDQHRIKIPPGDNNHKEYSTYKFDKDARILSFLPHMHLRGKSFVYKAVYPDGRSEILLSVPRYDFNWQSNYRLEKPLDVPAGTRIECTATYDNSAGNPNNPDPTREVHWGDQTWHEMMIGFIDYTIPKQTAAR